MDWTDAWRDAFRTELRAEAITFADHGWPVVPGSYPRGDRWINIPSSPRTGADQRGCVPVHPDWAQLAGCGPDRVAKLWSGHPFSVLLATGMGIDALDCPPSWDGPPRPARPRAGQLPDSFQPFHQSVTERSGPHFVQRNHTTQQPATWGSSTIV
jgi:hypothetical protein